MFGPFAILEVALSLINGREMMIDLRSDTVTLPSPAMYDAMSHAELGDDGRGEDPTVDRLEEAAVALTGKEAALFCPSGTMANILALLTYTDKNESIALHEASHIYRSEQSLFAEQFFARQARLFHADPGPQMIPAIRSAAKGAVVLALENTMAYASGAVISQEEMKAIAQAISIPIHLDGARIFNAAAHLNTSVQSLVEEADSVQFCLSKGLGAPVGSLLCGTASFIQHARSIRKMIGGNMRQAGILAAAGLIALEGGLEQAKEDNAKARYFLDLLKEADQHVLYKSLAKTNIVFIQPQYDIAQLLRQLKDRGILVRPYQDKMIRLVFHRQIELKQVEQVAQAFNDLNRKV